MICHSNNFTTVSKAKPKKCCFFFCLYMFYSLCCSSSDLLRLCYQTTLNSASINTLPATRVTLASSDRNTRLSDSVPSHWHSSSSKPKYVPLSPRFRVFVYVWTQPSQIISYVLSLMESWLAHTLNILRMFGSGLKQRFPRQWKFLFWFQNGDFSSFLPALLLKRTNHSAQPGRGCQNPIKLLDGN